MRRSASGDGLQALFLELGQDERVDRVGRPAGRIAGSTRGTAGRLSGLSDHQSRLVGRRGATAAAVVFRRAGQVRPSRSSGGSRRRPLAGSLPLGGIGSTPSAAVIA